MAVSDSGTLIASSQLGTKHHKGYASPVFIWQVQDCSRLTILRGLTIKANILSFSPDEKFLCGCDDVIISIILLLFTIIYCYCYYY